MPVTTLTAVFSQPHPAGSFATTAPFPNWVNWQRHVTIVVTAATVLSPLLLQQIKNYMEKWSRVVTTWDVIRDNGDRHHSGPMYPFDSGTYATEAAQTAAGYPPGHPNFTTIATIAY
jgi:hypothetical protein